MTERQAWPAGAVALAGPVALVALFMRPEVALAIGIAGMVAWLACASVAYPLALAGVPPIVFGIFGDNPLPEGIVSIGLAAAVMLAIGVAVHRCEAVPPAAVIAGAPLLLTLLLLCLLVLREPAAPETNYGELKTAFFVVSNVVFLAGGIFVGYNAERLRLLLLATLAVSVAGAALLVMYVAGGGQSILPVALTFSDSDHSISMGRQMAVGILVALAIVLIPEAAARRLVAIAALPLLGTALVASGARGPVVALIVGAFALLLLGLTDRVARRRFLAIVIAATTAAAMVQLVVPQTSVVRSFSFASTDVEGSSSGRTEMWAQAMRVISEHPALGIGTGGFADVNPPMIYPHNIMLEVGAELGIAGILLIVAFLGHAMARMAVAYRAVPEERLVVAAVVALFAAALTNAMFSYALHSNWEVWLWAGVGTALAARLLGDRSSLAAAPSAP